MIGSIVRKFPKAPGSDRITVKMMKSIHQKIIVQLYYIFKASINLHYFPLTLRSATVLAFPKPGKACTNQANYRPISLLSVVSKIFEKILYAQILQHLNTHHIIISEQYGFRSGHLTVLQLLRASEYFSMEVNKRRNSAMVLLDLKKAFDSVWHGALLFKLDRIRLPMYLIKIIRSYLNDRILALGFKVRNQHLFRYCRAPHRTQYWNLYSLTSLSMTCPGPLIRI